jgi:hypothetical protein
MLLTLKEDLKVSQYRKPNKHNFLIDNLTDKKSDYTKKVTTQSLFHVSNDLTGEVSHRNYMDYLLTAWDCHYGIVVSPDIIWYTLLCELTGIVAKKTEEYRDLFSTSKEKQEVIVYSDSMTIMPLNTLVSALKNKVPTDVNVFLPDFSTSNERSEFARYAAFADMVSPYYNYGMYCCGFPAIDVQGEQMDWKLIFDNWQNLAKLFKFDKSYFDKVSAILDHIVLACDDILHWKNMFELEECGSGHQYLVNGWLADMFVEKPRVRYTENYSAHISTVKYTQLQTKKNYEMKQGLFSSNLDSNNFLRPEFAKVVYEKTDEVSTPY